MRINSYQAKKFNDTLVKAAKEICPTYGIDPDVCIREAAHATLFGKFAISNNYWNLPGNGDKGCNVLVRVIRTGSTKDGGCKPILSKTAKFSSPEAAVREWCNRNRK